MILPITVHSRLKIPKLIKIAKKFGAELWWHKMFAFPHRSEAGEVSRISEFLSDLLKTKF